MVGYVQPLAHNFKIVTELGFPTEYFIRWAQQKQEDIGEAVSEKRALEIVSTFLAEHPLQEGSGIKLTPDGDLNNSPTISAEASEILDQLSSTQGSVLFRGSAGWEALPPGTNTQYLKSGGPSADPVWGTPSGGGGGGVSWANGAGERRFLIQASATGGSTGDPGQTLSPGPINSFYWNTGTTTKTLLYDFFSPNILQGIAFSQNAVIVNGVWTLAGSLDGVTYTNLVTDFVLGGTSYGPRFTPPGFLYVREFSNANAYRYYRLTLNTGQASSNGPYITQVMFKCEPIV